MEETKSMRVYELGFLIVPTVGDEHLPSEVTALKDKITSCGGVFIAEEFPRFIELAYRMEKNIANRKEKFTHAYFGWVKFELDRAKIADVKSKIDVLKNILRYIIVKTVTENTMHVVNKVPAFRKESTKDNVVVDGVDKASVSEAYIDKSIDELLVN